MDNITPNVKDFIKRFMLVPHSERIDTKSLHRFFSYEIQRQMHQGTDQDSLRPPGARFGACSSDSPRLPPDLPPIQTRNLSLNQERPHTGDTATPDLLLKVPSTANNNPSPVTSDTRNDEDRPPSITVEDVNAWLASKRRDPIPGMKQVMQEIKDRDQLFVVDDSKTMAQHKSRLYLTIKALLAFACQIDPDRVEIVFTSDPSKVVRDRRMFGGAEYLARKVLDHFDNGILGASTNMESKLGDIMHRYVPVEGLKRASIYVMTDAVWQPSSESGGGVESTLRNLIMRLKQHGKDRHCVTFQFIRFGDDPVGLRRLRYLDDDLAREAGMEDLYVDTGPPYGPCRFGRNTLPPEKYEMLKSVLITSPSSDIVDYREYDENVPHMLVGAYSRLYDAQDGHVDPKNRGLTTPLEMPNMGRRKSKFFSRRLFGG
ncbi:kinase-like domain-containing protein [Apiospora phragmitis]|uniref:Kinase-like domain-containing protein n=1 Tax=Apiospora phragmitis TaxID=2905665 RepID=A0ABR1UVI1_9PEZI